MSFRRGVSALLAAGWSAALLALCATSDAAPLEKGPGLLQAPPALVGMSPLDYWQRKQLALQLMADGRYPDARAELAALTAAYPFDGQLWHLLGQAHQELGDWAGSLEPLRRALALGIAHGGDEDAAALARACAKVGDAACAVQALDTAINALHFRDPDALLDDAVFDGLRSRAEFRRLRASTAGHGPGADGRAADLDVFVQQSTRWRPDLSTTQRRRLQAEADALKKRANGISLDEFAVELQGLHALLGRGHSGSPVMWDATALGGHGLEVLPVDFYLFPEGLYVVDGVGAGEALIGSRVVAFGSTSAEAALEKVARLIDRDPGSEMSVLWLGPRFLSMPAVQKVLGLTDSVHRSTLKLVAPDGSRRVVTLDGAPFRPRSKLHAPKGATAPVPQYLARVGEAYWATDLGPSTAYLQFNQVRDRPDESMSAFALRLRRELAASGTRHLIVDLRHNNGGDSYLYTELLRTLIAFDTQPGHSLYVISGRSTFSAAQNILVDIRRLTRAVVVGEPASAPRAGGEQVTYRLPRTGLPAGAAPVLWSLQSPADERVWIAPDVPLILSAADYFANRDPVLETVLKLIDRQ